MSRVWNFSAGPAALPVEVLLQAQAELLDWHGAGCSVMEMSHRGKEFTSIIEQAEADLRELMVIPAGYKVLFLQGGGNAAICPDSDESAGRAFSRLHCHRLVVQKGLQGSPARWQCALCGNDRE
jgi:hypothetical protein